MQDQQTVERLVLENMHRVVGTAKGLGARYRLSKDQLEDLISIGTVQLIERARVYDPAIVNEFWPSAFTFVFGVMRTHLRTQHRWEKVILPSTRESVATDKDLDIATTTMLENKSDNSVPDQERAAMGRELMERVLRRCPSNRTREMFRLHFEEGMTITEISEHLGVVRSYVSAEIIRTLNKVKTEVGQPISVQRTEDLTGKRFGHWTVLGEHQYIDMDTRKSSYMCECSCGTRRRVRKHNLTRRMSLSCGCSRKRVKG